MLIVAFGPAAEARAWWRITMRISRGSSVNLEEADGGGVVLDFLDGGSVFAMVSTAR